MKITASIDLIIVGSFGVNTVNSAFCVCFQFVYCDSVFSVTHTVSFLSIIKDLEWDFSKLAAFVIFVKGVTFPVVILLEG